MEEIRSTSFQTLRVTKDLPPLGKDILSIELLHDNVLGDISQLDVSLEWHQSFVVLVTLSPSLVSRIRWPMTRRGKRVADQKSLLQCLSGVYAIGLQVSCLTD